MSHFPMPHQCDMYPEGVQENSLFYQEQSTLPCMFSDFFICSVARFLLAARCPPSRSALRFNSRSLLQSVDTGIIEAPFYNRVPLSSS